MAQTLTTTTIPNTVLIPLALTSSFMSFEDAPRFLQYIYSAANHLISYRDLVFEYSSGAAAIVQRSELYFPNAGINKVDKMKE